MRVAALQSDIVWENPTANFERIDPWIAAAAKVGVRLFVLPEMFACGFSMATERVAEPKEDGASLAFLRSRAARHDMWIAGSIPEREDPAEAPFNTLALVAPDGTTHRYRKIHPFTFAGEDKRYQAGRDFVTVTVEGLRLTLFVCYDLRFADEFWATAPDTDAYLVVANWPEPRRHHWSTLLRARAIENQAYVVGVNRVGTDPKLRYTGDSQIIDPVGNVVAAGAEQETMLVADLDPSMVAETRKAFPFLPDRR